MNALVWPQQVTIREVGLRDGLQSIARTLPTAHKLQWIQGAYDAGIREIYGEVAREILSRDDWISLWWAQEDWFWSKPIFIFWIEGRAPQDGAATAPVASGG
jgi:hypothetical protein